MPAHPFAPAHWATALTLSVVLATACADPDSAGILLPQAPDLGPADGGTLQGTMWRIAFLTGLLEDLVEDPRGPATHRDEILDVLTQIEAAARPLEDDGVGADHDLVARHGRAFVEDVRQARRDVEHEPPSFGRAAAIYDTCLRCHDG